MVAFLSTISFIVLPIAFLANSVAPNSEGSNIVFYSPINLSKDFLACNKETKEPSPSCINLTASEKTFSIVLAGLPFNNL